MLNIRFVIKMLGLMFILETIFMLTATAVAFFYKGDDFLACAHPCWYLYYHRGVHDLCQSCKCSLFHHGILTEFDISLPEAVYRILEHREQQKL